MAVSSSGAQCSLVDQEHLGPRVTASAPFFLTLSVTRSRLLFAYSQTPSPVECSDALSEWSPLRRLALRKTVKLASHIARTFTASPLPSRPTTPPVAPFAVCNGVWLMLCCAALACARCFVGAALLVEDSTATETCTSAPTNGAQVRPEGDTLQNRLSSVPMFGAPITEEPQTCSVEEKPLRALEQLALDYTDCEGESDGDLGVDEHEQLGSKSAGACPREYAREPVRSANPLLLTSAFHLAAAVPNGSVCFEAPLHGVRSIAAIAGDRMIPSAGITLSCSVLTRLNMREPALPANAIMAACYSLTAIVTGLRAVDPRPLSPEAARMVTDEAEAWARLLSGHSREDGCSVLGWDPRHLATRIVALCGDQDNVIVDGCAACLASVAALDVLATTPYSSAVPMRLSQPPCDAAAQSLPRPLLASEASAGDAAGILPVSTTTATSLVRHAVAARVALGPGALLVALLGQTGFEPSLLVDLLVSPESGMLPWLLRCGVIRTPAILPPRFCCVIR